MTELSDVHSFRPRSGMTGSRDNHEPDQSDCSNNAVSKVEGADHPHCCPAWSITCTRQCTAIAECNGLPPYCTRIVSLDVMTAEAQRSGAAAEPLADQAFTRHDYLARTRARGMFEHGRQIEICVHR